MTNSTLSAQALANDNKFSKILEDSLAIRYMFFAEKQFGSNNVLAFVFGYRKLEAGAKRQLFWLRTPLYPDSCNVRTELNLYDPAETLQSLKDNLSEWEDKGPQYPWWNQLLQPKPFVGALVFNTSTVRDADQYNQVFSFFHGMLFERINTYTTMFEDIARKDRSLSNKHEASKLLQRRFTSFITDVREKQIAQMFGSATA